MVCSCLSGLDVGSKEDSGTNLECNHGQCDEMELLHKTFLDMNIIL